MKNERMIEKALATVGMGLPEMISEVDALVFADEEILNGHLAAKDRRAARFEQKKDQKKRNKRLYDPSNVTHWGKKAAYNVFRGITPVFHGEDEPVAFIKKSRKNGTKQLLDKIDNRKIRHENKVRYEKLPEFEAEERIPDFEELYTDSNFEVWYDFNLYNEKNLRLMERTVLLDHDDFWWRQYLSKNWKMVDSDNGEIVVRDRGNYCNSLEEDDRVYLQLHAARKMMRMRNRIEEIKAEKGRLLEEYANKIKALNKDLCALEGILEGM